MQKQNSRNYDSTSLNVKPSRFGSHAGFPSLTSDLRESDGRGIMSSCSAGLVQRERCCSSHLMEKGKQTIWINLMEEASCQVALLASSSALIAAPAIWWTRKAGDLRESDARNLRDVWKLGTPNPPWKIETIQLHGKHIIFSAILRHTHCRQLQNKSAEKKNKKTQHCHSITLSPIICWSLRIHVQQIQAAKTVTNVVWVFSHGPEFLARRPKNHQNSLIPNPSTVTYRTNRLFLRHENLNCSMSLSKIWDTQRLPVYPASMKDQAALLYAHKQGYYGTRCQQEWGMKIKDLLKWTTFKCGVRMEAWNSAYLAGTNRWQQTSLVIAL